ncbi:MAG TPA: cupin domain-containing protein [Steroidobacteraceae bacterium]|nr:cupin domain-containing protein [Steroidobacteraceae bacterium]
MADDTLDLLKNYLFLDPDGTTALLPGGGEFWSQLMSGKPSDPGIRRLMGSRTGRLLATLPLRATWTNWEMHPAGDEILYLLEGKATFTLDLAGGTQEVELSPGRLLVIPQGVWHTASVSEPGSMLAITAGAGTEHRPR